MMNTRKIVFWCGLMFAALITSWAAEAGALAPVTSTTSPGTNTLLLALIPVLVPLLIAVSKWALPKVPVWILPILAPALGALIDFLTTWASGAASSPLIGAVLGSAGVGLREILDQVKGRMHGNPKLPLLLLAFALPAATLTIGVTGCASTPKEAIVYNTFRSSWIVSKTAYGIWCERVVQGKATPEAEKKADDAWNKYRASFKFAFAVTTTNWSSQTPANLDLAQKELLELLNALSQ